MTLKRLFKKFEKIIKYFCFSALSTLLDVAVVWVLLHQFKVDLVIANTVGVISGFILSYLLSSKTVFDTELGAPGFIIFFGTFLLGLVAADALISGSYRLIRPHISEHFAFLISKGVSIVIPFFGLYFLRKWLYGLLRKRKGKQS